MYSRRGNRSATDNAAWHNSCSSPRTLIARRAHTLAVAEGHAVLKAFLARFRGISMRRLHGYLMWFKWQREARRLGDLPGAIREHMGSARYRLSWRERVGAPYPFHREMAVQIEG